MSVDVFHALEKFWDTQYSQGRVPKRVEKAHFLKFEVTFLEILTCRTNTDAGFGISGPKLVKTNHQTFCNMKKVKFCWPVRKHMYHIFSSQIHFCKITFRDTCCGTHMCFRLMT